MPCHKAGLLVQMNLCITRKWQFMHLADIMEQDNVIQLLKQKIDGAQISATATFLYTKSANMEDILARFAQHLMHLAMVLGLLMLVKVLNLDQLKALKQKLLFRRDLPLQSLTQKATLHYKKAF